MDGLPTSGTLSASGLTKRFGAVTALDGVDLEVRRGESIALFGPNGAGKTTLIRILTGALSPSGGTFRVDGLDPRRDGPAVRGRIGMLSHASWLYESLSALENLEFFARLYGVAEPRRRAQALLDELGLGHRAHDTIRSLSRGSQQRVSLARALVHDPPIVLLDEPFSGLDPQASETLRRMLERLRAAARTIVLVTHDLQQGLKLAERWVLLDRGRVVGQGDSRSTDPATFGSTYLERVRAQPAR